MFKRNHIVKFLIGIGLITAFLGCATTQGHESAGQYLDDTVITTKVKTGILEEQSLKVFQISVKSYQGIVRLSGAVETEHNKATAGVVASRVTGVTKVINDLTLK